MVYSTFSVGGVFTKWLFILARVHFNVGYIIYFSFNLKNPAEMPHHKIQTNDLSCEKHRPSQSQTHKLYPLTELSYLYII